MLTKKSLVTGQKREQWDKFQTNLHVSQTYLDEKAKANWQTITQTVSLTYI